MHYSIIYAILISAVIPAIRGFILDVYGGMVAWDYMNGGRRFNCAQQKKKHESDKRIPVIDLSHFLQEAKQSYNDLKNYNDERERQRQVEAERQRQVEAERQRQQQEQEERDRQDKISKQQKMEQERVENQKKQEADRLRLEEKRLQMIREQLRHAEEQKRQQLLEFEQERDRQRLKQLDMLERIKLAEEVERLRKLVDQQQNGWKPIIPSQPGAEFCSVKTPDNRVDDDAWRDYIFDWKYDHCIISSYV